MYRCMSKDPSSRFVSHLQIADVASESLMVPVCDPTFVQLNTHKRLDVPKDCVHAAHGCSSSESLPLLTPSVSVTLVTTWRRSWARLPVYSS